MITLSSGAIAAILRTAKSTSDVDNIFWTLVKDGHVPRYIAKDYWVGRVIKANGHVLELLVAPDYGGAGDDDDAFRFGNESQVFAQNFADHYGSILPSQKLLDVLEASADVKIPFIAVQRKDPKTGAMVADGTVEGTIKANTLAAAALAKAGATPGDGKLKIGYRKAYVVRPGLDGRYIAIYGGRLPGGGRVQGPSGTRHDGPYSDYSHGIVLVNRKARLDGRNVDLRDDVFLSKDPSIYGLVSDEGRFDPVFPNAGGGAGGKMSVSIDPATGKPLGGRGGATGAESTSKTVRMVTGGIVGIAAAMMLSLPPLWSVGIGLAGAAIGRFTGGTS